MIINSLNSSPIGGVPTNIPKTSQVNEENYTTRDLFSNNHTLVKNISKQYDVTSISPVEMAKMSQQLFDTGNINLKQHSMLSFQPEMNPVYNTTIGKMTNKVGQPNEPKNFLGEWESRLVDQLNQNVPNEVIQNTKEIVSILANINTLRSSQQT